MRHRAYCKDGRQKEEGTRHKRRNKGRMEEKKCWIRHRTDREEGGQEGRYIDRYGETKCYDKVP